MSEIMPREAHQARALRCVTHELSERPERVGDDLYWLTQIAEEAGRVASAAIVRLNVLGDGPGDEFRRACYALAATVIEAAACHGHRRELARRLWRDAEPPASETGRPKSPWLIVQGEDGPAAEQVEAELASEPRRMTW